MEEQGLNIGTIPQTAIRYITSPAAFYREMPKTGGFLAPLVFLVVMGVIGGLIQAVASLLHLHPAAGFMAGLGSIIFVPIMVAIFSFISAAILFVIWKLMGSQESYETAYRCGAYAAAFTPITMILGLIPYAGSAINLVIMTYLLVMASVEVHSLAANKAWTVFGIIGAILILLSISGQMAARKFAGQMRQGELNFEQKATTGGDEESAPAGPAKSMSDAVSAMKEAAKHQLDASIAQMEAQMASMPPDQQTQMREEIQKMKESRAQMDD